MVCNFTFKMWLERKGNHYMTMCWKFRRGWILSASPRPLIFIRSLAKTHRYKKTCANDVWSTVVRSILPRARPGALCIHTWCRDSCTWTPAVNKQYLIKFFSQQYYLNNVCNIIYNEIYRFRKRSRGEYSFTQIAVFLPVHEHRPGSFVISRPTVGPIPIQNIRSNRMFQCCKQK